MEALKSRLATFQKKTGIEATSTAFGRSEMLVIEISAEDLRATAIGLRSDSELRFDWLEFMSVYEDKGRLYLSYFIRSQSRAESCVLRTSLEPETANEWVAAPSLTTLWPMLKPFEEEAARLFGIQFLDDQRLSPCAGPAAKFPLRKSFKWKRESS